MPGSSYGTCSRHGREVVGQRKAIAVAMDWTDFDADASWHELLISAPQNLPGARPLQNGPEIIVDLDSLADTEIEHVTTWRRGRISVRRADCCFRRRGVICAGDPPVSRPFSRGGRSRGWSRTRPKKRLAFGSKESVYVVVRKR